MKKLDTGKLGRSYLAVLWLSATALTLMVVGNWIREYRRVLLGVSLERHWWYDGVVLLGGALVYGIASWGVFRKQLWSYYLSLVITIWWVANGACDFFMPPLTNVPRWSFAVVFVLGAVALAWLASPALRSPFPPGFGKAKVA